MRIIAGKWRGRRLAVPGRGLSERLRPTSDRAREGLFNIIGPAVTERRVLELFAGTGALSLEALSRGAASALLLEQHPAVFQVLRRNLELCGLTGGSAVGALRRDCTGRLAFLAALAPPGGFNLVLADPPYGQNLAAAVLCELAALASVPGLLAPDLLLILETGHREKLPSPVGPLLACRQPRRYGEALFHFYQLEDAPTNEQL